MTHAAVEDGRDYNADGFYARTMADEKPIEGLFVEQLIGIEDVTARVQKATRGKEGAARGEALNQSIAAIERACHTSDDLRCDVDRLGSGIDRGAGLALRNICLLLCRLARGALT